MRLRSIRIALVSVSVLFLLQVGCEPSAPREQPDCQPCSFEIHPDLPLYLFTFEVEYLESGERLAKTIRVQRHPTEDVLQELDISAMSPLAPEDSFSFSQVDLNLDGFGDLALVTSRGVANTYADYWVFDPHGEQFYLLGNFPWLTIKSETGLLRSYERGGHGGMIYEDREYRFTHDSLAVVRIEKQDWEDDVQQYRRVIQELIDGKLEVVHEELVARPPRS